MGTANLLLLLVVVRLFVASHCPFVGAGSPLLVCSEGGINERMHFIR